MTQPSITPDEIERRFAHHPPIGRQGDLYAENRAQFMALARYLGEVLPASREASLALTALQESLMWTNAAIACNGVGVDDEETAS